MGALFYVLAVVLFVLAGFGVSMGEVDSHELGWFGLASFALGHLIGGTWADLRTRV